MRDKTSDPDLLSGLSGRAVPAIRQENPEWHSTAKPAKPRIAMCQNGDFESGSGCDIWRRAVGFPIRKKDYVSIHTDVSDALASAFMLRAGKLDIPLGEVSPSCIGGVKYLAFARGMAAAKAMTEAMDILDCEDVFSISGRGPSALLKYTKGEK
ncbi:MAG: hypothetical protein IPH35_24460 [Rhodoferax sp.]|nr:hypothetical protein [Rhodoferax sp.]